MPDNNVPLPPLDVTEEEFQQADRLIALLLEVTKVHFLTPIQMAARDGYAITSCRERQLQQALNQLAEAKEKLSDNVPLPEDYRPGRDYLSNQEIESTGILCGGAVSNIARELIERRNELAALKSALSDPAAVHSNILRGTIAMSRTDAIHIAGLPADVDKQLAEIAALRETNSGWLKANGPGGWIDALRAQNERLKAPATEEDIERIIQLSRKLDMVVIPGSPCDCPEYMIFHGPECSCASKGRLRMENEFRDKCRAQQTSPTQEPEVKP